VIGVRTRSALLALALLSGSVAPAAALSAPDGVLHEFGEIVDYQMLFPVASGADYTYYRDTFWASRPNGLHHAQDIMAPKMTPVVAPVAGTIGWVNWSSDPYDPRPNPHRCCTLTINHDDGWSSWYIHLNNDTPGTDDGLGWGIAPGIAPGVRVSPGQVVGWVGDSGNAEDTPPHLHFELRDPEGTIVNPIAALDAATWVDLELRCGGELVTIHGTNGDDVIIGTDGDDVIHGRGGDDFIDGRGGNDIICGGAGDDVIYGGPGDDILYGGPGNDRIYGNGGHDVLHPGPGKDRVFGGPGNDRYVAGPGRNRVSGGPGVDIADYRKAPHGAVVDLGAGTGVGPGTDRLRLIENVYGSPFADILIGDDGPNLLRGFAGDDTLIGGAGDDHLIGGSGTNTLDGGEGRDWCKSGIPTSCELGPAQG
jgi:hypothetical protein